MEKPELKTTSTDIAAATARGVAAACPFIGGLISEAVNQIIPNQKIDRIIEYLQILDGEVSRLKGDFTNVEKHLKDQFGLDLFEDSLVQASRAVTKERRSRIANLMANSISQEDLKYAESKKMLNLLQELNDPELIMLIYYSKPVTMESVYHEQLREKHPEILRPATRGLGRPQGNIDRHALQDSYKNTLLRFGLIEERHSNFGITALGKLLLKYIEKPEEEDAMR